MKEAGKNWSAFSSLEEFGLKQLSIISHLEMKPVNELLLRMDLRLIRQFKGSGIKLYRGKMRDYLEFLGW